MSLQASRLACTRGKRQLFAGIGFELQPGDALQVAGVNGSGKTSLLRLLAGLSPPDDGEVRWNGCDIRRRRDEFCRSLVYLGHAGGVKDDLLAWENLAVAATLAGHPVDRDDALDALDMVGLGRAAWLPARALSQGQRKRVALARLELEIAAPLWILDEPFTALDATAIDSLRQTLDRHLAHGGMLVYTTHQPVELRARRAQCMELGGSAAC